jgi:hypothetical protein
MLGLVLASSFGPNAEPGSSGKATLLMTSSIHISDYATKSVDLRSYRLSGITHPQLLSSPSLRGFPILRADSCYYFKLGFRAEPFVNKTILFGSQKTRE